MQLHHFFVKQNIGEKIGEIHQFTYTIFKSIIVDFAGQKNQCIV
jgi:hypothetical protein